VPTALAVEFRAELDCLRDRLIALPHALAEVPWRDGGWTRKEIVGHLLDSATNNRQRFVRAGTEGHYSGPTYAQEAWVRIHGYAGQAWETLLDWWQVEHAMLAAVVENLPESSLDAVCTVGENEPATLRFLIEDYLRHHRLHVEQAAHGTAQAG
jgi:hypothetical protein